MCDREPGGVAEQFHGHVRRCRVARRSIVEGTGFGFHQGDQLPRIAGREIRTCDQQHRKGSNQANWREVACRLVGQAGDQHRVDARHPAIDHDQRVSVGRRLGGSHHADGATATRAVFDNDRLAKAIRQSGCHLARENVGESARGDRGDELDGVVGIRLGARRGRRDHARQRSDAQG